MEKKLITAAAFGLLCAVFALVSLLVILTKRHPFFVAKKLRLGALLISLSGAAAGCSTPTPTCYDPVGYNYIEVDQINTQNYSISLNRSVSDTVTGKIYSRRGTMFSYAVCNSADSIVSKDNIPPFDGAFDENTEEFKIGLDRTIPAGDYDLRFYQVSKDSIQNSRLYIRSIPIIISD